MSHFHVQPITLEHTASALEVLRAELTELSSAPSLSAPALGRGNVAPSIEEFLSMWGTSMSRLENQMSTLADNLNKAAINYQMSETFIVSAGSLS